MRIFLLRARWVYFLFYGAWAAFIPFLPLYYQSLGYKGGQIGLLTSLVPLITLVGAPVWGGLADATHHHRRVLLGAMLGAMAAAGVILGARSLGWLALGIGAYAFFNAPIVPLVDHSVLSMLGERRNEYGRIRLWGAVGWGLSGPLAGWLAGNYGASAPFGLYLLVMGLAWLMTAGLNVSPGVGSGNYWKDARLLLRERRWWFFLLVVFFAGVAGSTVNNYLFLYMAELNAQQTLMGLALAAATVSEVPALFFSSKLVKRLGARGVVLMALGAYIVRLLLYSVIQAPWQVLLVQLLHGLTFASLWAAGVAYAHELAPRGLGATAQGVFNATLMGLGAITGALTGGFLLERLGGAGMFRVVALAVLIGALIFLVADRRQRQNHPIG
ncbi:MAG TPA: MFS transporter [Anaerolinea thermolimosa]|mgnify:CR=1 FL=1|uniref:MFS transporter n=1 Tax=Anaerolinea thermolimosa TaxID=229919 RepID=A0A3D1JDS3_9CHLR|nr:major facilitator superfamily domain-containing protein 6 [Anaerolinea thermolimosa]GAP07599.1 arabinose efflux permease [Anaerolinea thermolimosa]HCE16672.1 MFS transporter [Anaerolinea thermolimosa]